MMNTEELLKYIDSFVPVWQGELTPDSRLLDFEEKWNAFHTPRGRLMSCAHRGDRNEAYYPENSLEGFISSVMIGADILEADIHTTKDGVLIVMHDDTLTRTTNVSALRASGVKLPETDNICDWTYEEICLLNLISKHGNVTEYKVPTLEELIVLAKDRAFVTLDKTGHFNWDGVMELIYKHKAYRTVLIPYDYKFERVTEIRQKMLCEVGIAAPYFAKSIRGAGILDRERVENAVEYLKENGMPPLLRCGGYKPEEDENHALILADVKATHRLYGETLVDANDHRENWQRMTELGYNIIMGNNIYAMVEFVKEKL